MTDNLNLPQAKRVPLRCRLFGHRWGAWNGGSWHEPNFGATAGALSSVARCKRCPARWRDHHGHGGLSLEQLAERVREQGALDG